LLFLELFRLIKLAHFFLDHFRVAFVLFDFLLKFADHQLGIKHFRYVLSLFLFLELIHSPLSFIFYLLISLPSFLDLWLGHIFHAKIAFLVLLAKRKHFLLQFYACESIPVYFLLDGWLGTRKFLIFDDLFPFGLNNGLIRFQLLLEFLPLL
jgi:hypothetical protein